MTNYLWRMRVFSQPQRIIEIPFEVEDDVEARNTAYKLYTNEVERSREGEKILQTESSLFKQISYP